MEWNLRQQTHVICILPQTNVIYVRYDLQQPSRKIRTCCESPDTTGLGPGLGLGLGFGSGRGPGLSPGLLFTCFSLMRWGANNRYINMTVRARWKWQTSTTSKKC